MSGPPTASTTRSTCLATVSAAGTSAYEVHRVVLPSVDRSVDAALSRKLEMPVFTKKRLLFLNLFAVEMSHVFWRSSNADVFKASATRIFYTMRGFRRRSDDVSSMYFLDGAAVE